MGQDGLLGGFYSPSPSMRAEHRAAQTLSCSVLVKVRGEGGSLEGGRVTAGSALGKGFGVRVHRTWGVRLTHAPSCLPSLTGGKQMFNLFDSQISVAGEVRRFGGFTTQITQDFGL